MVSRSRPAAGTYVLLTCSPMVLSIDPPFLNRVTVATDFSGIPINFGILSGRKKDRASEADGCCGPLEGGNGMNLKSFVLSGLVWAGLGVGAVHAQAPKPPYSNAGP